MAQDDFPEACEQLARSIADEVHTETKLPCGYKAEVKDKLQRVEFTFRVGVTEDRMKYSYPIESIEVLKSAITWQPIFEKLVRLVLYETSPLGYAQRIARRQAEPFVPEVPVFVDQAGRRHFVMKCETGYLEGILSAVKMTKGDNPQ